LRASIETSDIEHLGDSRVLTLSFASISAMPDNNNFYHISMNPLFTIAGLFLSPAFYIPQVFPNLRIQPNLYKECLRGMLGLNTDYFMFYKNSRVYSEAFVGVKISLWKVATGIQFCVPISQGYLRDKHPYYCLTISYVLDQNEPPHESPQLTE
jgi:hypothetical protein